MEDNDDNARALTFLNKSKVSQTSRIKKSAS